MPQKNTPRFALAALSLFFFSTVAFTQTDCSALEKLKSQTYGFHPFKLTDAQREQKSKAMDAFWDAVKAAGPKGAACLKSMISADKSDGFFQFDAASLLSEIDVSGGSDPSIAEAVSRADLSDIQIPSYLEMALRLSHKGIDIGPIAHTYMHHPDVVAYLPAHGGYKVDRLAGAILLYGSMKPELVDRYLAREVTATEQDTRDTAALVWAMNLTGESYKGIVALGDMKTFSKEARDSVAAVRKIRAVSTTAPAKYTRQQILDKLARFPRLDENLDEAEAAALDNSTYLGLRAEDLPAFREARRKLIQGVSNESAEGYAEMSRVLLNLVNKLDLYREYRIP